MIGKIKIKDLATIILFLGALGAFFILNLLKTPDELSYSERRRLAQFPDISIESIFNSKAMEGFDDYSVDQFSFREQFRGLKARFDLNVWLKADSNAIFTIGEHVFKTDYPLRENSIKRLCNINNYIYDTYLQGMNVKYAFVPDKNYYINDKSRHLVIDYAVMKNMIRENMAAQIEEIELFEYLSLDSYYMTDAHWKQETLIDAAQHILESMNPHAVSYAGALPDAGYREETFFPFYGAYYGQSALSVQPDTLTYLVSGLTDEAPVTSVELPGKILPVYDTTQLGGMDSYNLFMLGPQAIVRAENPENPDGKELIIFRDSFSSSIAPLLLPGYSAVTLIDLRYIVPELLGQFVDFAGQDVLFMYSAGLFNTSDSIKAPASTQFVSPFVARAVIED